METSKTNRLNTNDSKFFSSYFVKETDTKHTLYWKKNLRLILSANCSIILNSLFIIDGSLSWFCTDWFSIFTSPWLNQHISAPYKQLPFWLSLHGRMYSWWFTFLCFMKSDFVRNFSPNSPHVYSLSKIKNNILQINQNSKTFLVSTRNVWNLHKNVRDPRPQDSAF